MAALIVNQQTVRAGTSAPHQVLVTGSGTAWTPGTPGSPTFTATRGTVTAQTVLTATTATLTYAAPATPGPDALTNGTDTGSISVASRVPHFVPRRR